MLIALSGKNKEGFVDGSIKKPEGKSAAWKCNNDIITSWILNSVSKEIAASINYAGSTQEVWDELHTRFKQSNGPHIYQLRKDLITTAQGTSSVEAYYTKLKTIWQDLVDYRPTYDCSCGGIKPIIEHMESEFVMIFLMGLNDSYSSVRAQILLMNPIPAITKVFSLIIQEERQRIAGNSISPPPTDQVTLLAAEASKKQNNTRFRRNDNQRPFCSHCNIRGHTVDKCYKLHGYPPRYKFRNSENDVNPKPVEGNVVAQPQANFFSSLNQSQYNQLIEILNTHLHAAKTEPIAAASSTVHVAGICSDTFNSNTWILDSGASRHICHQRELFHNWRRVHGVTVILPTTYCMSVEFIGDIRLSEQLLLQDVLFVPQFTYNLISVSYLLNDKNLVINFSGSSCTIHDRNLLTMIGKAESSNGLYVFSPDKSHCLFATVCSVSLDTWHSRLGHTSFQRLSLLKNTLHFSHSPADYTPCHICP